jgi:hypothetical protein
MNQCLEMTLQTPFTVKWEAIFLQLPTLSAQQPNYQGFIENLCGFWP